MLIKGIVENRQINNKNAIDVQNFEQNVEPVPITLFQLFGLILMVVSIICLLVEINLNSKPSGLIIASDFFLIMLGFAILFPELLKDHTKGLSTMRIVVFMISNVIAMVFIKVGFSENITSLEDIKLDWVWLGLIAFVFGAKAVQSYFESKLFSFGNPDTKSEVNRINWHSLNEDQQFTVMSDCKSEYESKWISDLDNITGVGLGIKETNGRVTDKRAILFQVPKKLDLRSIKNPVPKYITYRNFEIPTDVTESNVADACAYLLPTEIYSGIDNNPRKLGSSISRVDIDKSTGTLGLIVNSINLMPSRKYALSCFHVLFPDKITLKQSIEISNINMNVCSPSKEDLQKTEDLIILGETFIGVLNKEVDCGIFEIQEESAINEFENKIIPKEAYDIQIIDVSLNTKIKSFGRTSQWQEGRVLLHNVTKTINYGNNTRRTMSNLIQTTRISSAGDSGGCVMLKKSNRVIGIIVATDSKNNYSFVVPISPILKSLNVKL